MYFFVRNFSCNTYNESDNFKLDPLNFINLKKEKSFKMGKKLNKDHDTLKKKQAKERQAMQKKHTTDLEKLTKGRE